MNENAIEMNLRRIVGGRRKGLGALKRIVFSVEKRDVEDDINS